MDKKIILLACLIFTAESAIGDICDYVPSKYIGEKASGAAGASAGVTATTGFGMKAAGYYALTHSTSGLAMLGSTSAGASAAGTTGIIAGTSGVIGTVGATLMSPFVIIPAAIIATSIAAYEGGCYLTSK